MKMIRKIILIVFSLFVCVELFVGFPFEYGFGPHVIVKKEPSPDGRMVALYSWNPIGLLGWIVRDESNPIIYLRVLDRETGQVLAESSGWGDVPNDVIDRLGEIIADIIPWHEE